MDSHFQMTDQNNQLQLFISHSDSNVLFFCPDPSIIRCVYYIQPHTTNKQNQLDPIILVFDSFVKATEFCISFEFMRLTKDDEKKFIGRKINLHNLLMFKSFSSFSSFRFFFVDRCWIVNGHYIEIKT